MTRRNKEIHAKERNTKISHDFKINIIKHTHAKEEKKHEILKISEKIWKIYAEAEEINK